MVKIKENNKEEIVQNIMGGMEYPQKELTKEVMIELLKEHNIELVRVECEDTNGVSRGFTLDVNYFLRQVNGGVPISISIYGFKVNGCEVIPDTGVMGEIGFANGAMYPEIKTFKVLPWEPNVASILSDVRNDNGNPKSRLVPMSPRTMCKVQLEKLKSLGIQLFGAFENEFYLLSKETRQPVTNYRNVFSTRSQSSHIPFVKEVMKSMKAMDIHPEVHHTECGQSQQEITWSPAFGIQSPDNSFRMKNLVKDIASKHDLLATFMSKPFRDQLGSSGHYNHSLWNLHGNSLMYDEKRKYGLSELAEHWLAGLIHHSSALMCLAATSQNCYERIRLGGFAPENNTWGFDNRTVLYRVKNKGSPNLYFENRMPGAAVNPYLFVAGCIIAGLDGINRKMKLEVKPFNAAISEESTLPEQVKSLPTDMLSALETLKENDVFVKELGPEFIKCFSAARKAECESIEKIQASTDMFSWHRDNYADFL